MEVSAAYVDRELAELSAQLLRRGQQPAVWLHFGVHGLASCFKLEVRGCHRSICVVYCCWNRSFSCEGH